VNRAPGVYPLNAWTHLCVKKEYRRDWVGRGRGVGGRGQNLIGKHENNIFSFLNPNYI